MTSPSTRCPRRTWVQMVMGLPVSVVVRGPTADEAPVANAVDVRYAQLRALDGVLRTYRADSEVSRIRSGSLAPAAASPLVSRMLDLCEQAR